MSDGYTVMKIYPGFLRWSEMLKFMWFSCRSQPDMTMYVWDGKAFRFHHLRTHHWLAAWRLIMSWYPLVLVYHPSFMMTSIPWTYQTGCFILVDESRFVLVTGVCLFALSAPFCCRTKVPMSHQCWPVSAVHGKIWLGPKWYDLWYMHQMVICHWVLALSRPQTVAA